MGPFLTLKHVSEGKFLFKTDSFDLVDDHHIDQAALDVGQKLFETGALERLARDPGLFVILQAPDLQLQQAAELMYYAPRCC